MRLEKSRQALTLAEKYLGILEELVNDPEEFVGSFVGAIAVIRRVGNAVDVESKALGRTSHFKQLWAETGKDRRYLCVKEVRDLVLHQPEEGAHIHHEANAVGTGQATARALGPKVITGEARTAHIDLAWNQREPERYTFSSPAPVAEAGSTCRRTWVLAKGECAGEEVLPILRKYLDLMRDRVIPAAEVGG